MPAENRTGARYDGIADFYEGFAPDIYDDPLIRALLDLTGDIRSLRVLDMACGHGRITRELARRGARVKGIDISKALLAKARESEESDPLGITYLHADVASSDALAGETFDAVVCHFGLSDIDDLDGTVATVARALRQGGFFTFSILHPCFPGWPSRGASSSWPPGRGYFEEGWWRSSGPPGGVRTKVGASHRMLSTDLNTLARSGLPVAEAAEPTPPQDWLEEAPVTGPVPLYLAIRCVRP
jgi:SAM-dependent methyltransferase